MLAAGDEAGDCVGESAGSLGLIDGSRRRVGDSGCGDGVACYGRTTAIEVDIGNKGSVAPAGVAFRRTTGVDGDEVTRALRSSRCLG